MKSTGVIGFQVWNNLLIQYKNDTLGLPLGKKTEIEIPKVINNKLLFFSFMRGIFDTGGCLYIENKRGSPYPRIEIRTTSRTLHKQIINNFYKYGFPCKYFKFIRKEKNWNNIYTIRFNGFSNLKKWDMLIGTNNP